MDCSLAHGQSLYLYYYPNATFTLNHVVLAEVMQLQYDEMLEQQQQSRQVIWSTSHFMAVPFFLANSDCVALLPRRMAQQCAEVMDLKLLTLPIEVEGFTVSMTWHQRNIKRPQHQWLRERIVDVTKNI